ncbi:MAG: carbamoyl-phosphate synthase large subunit [Planctomycetes bacterium]|nr:carbamoyl-phosphate synthase large subunit [Planctomycetota bacterium]
MPRRTDISKILVIGSGPIIIGQACEFDYSGTQACKALLAEGYHVVLVNSNPATIMTDPQFSDRTYIEPITPEVVEAIIRAERPDALLPTVGGQTALNTAKVLAERGVLARYGVEMIGASPEAIQKAESREHFKACMEKIGLAVPAGRVVRTVDEALGAGRDLGLPVILRPSFTLGGTGGGTAYNVQELKVMAKAALEASPIHQTLIEESIIGWKEFELEVMRDLADNVVIICSIENFDPMGVHTGDSITVAPAQTLSDREYQAMRDAAVAIIREIGVETGGSNIQFAVNPADGDMRVIEMNPRVSRSSALASKATGFPIAKIAAKLAVGYTLDEIPNDITRRTPASFEPTIDYCVVKVPRFTFEKFPQTEPVLNTSMRSVGEAMAVGRSFKEALQKALRSLEIGVAGLDDPKRALDGEALKHALVTPSPERIFHLKVAFRQGMSVEEAYALTWIDPWFLDNIQELAETEEDLRRRGAAADRVEDALSAGELLEAKQLGFSDRQLARLLGAESEEQIRRWRLACGIRPVYKLVDTCAAEFEAFTPYYYSTYEQAPIYIK